eukprot:1649982-Pleurochrysis_carterae.AAC.1
MANVHNPVGLRLRYRVCKFEIIISSYISFHARPVTRPVTGTPVYFGQLQIPDRCNKGEVCYRPCYKPYFY